MSAPQEKEKIQQHRQGKREPREPVPPAISDEGREQADDAERADEYWCGENLPKRFVMLHESRHEDAKGDSTAEFCAMTRSMLTRPCD